MSYLQELLTSTHARVAEARSKISDDALEQRIASVPAPRGFRRALQDDDEVSIIAEIKRASPSKPSLREDLDAAPLARAYADGGAAAVSVLTEPDRFKGSIEDLQAATGAGLPVLRKDFILDLFQVQESRAIGADALLLIVRVLGNELDDLLRATTALGMDALVEVYDEVDVERALAAGANLIGINHRDLETFEVDPRRTAKLAPSIPDGITIVGLSGVSSRGDVEAMREAGAHAVLVGESLVTAADPAAKLRELRGVA
ncbi:MAG TPA: indole-3-glycerol phosphate synthase TrpC [Actinomycetota bacterium]|nr:indole-3-glycerol phosphate synthase TrpC [Actinomycetota bacterium]